MPDDNERILSACLAGFLLPMMPGATRRVMFVPDTVSWDAGVMAVKGDKSLFVLVQPRHPEQAVIAEITDGCREFGQASIMIIAASPEEIAESAPREWLHNPRFASAHVPKVVETLPPSLPAQAYVHVQPGADAKRGGNADAWDARERAHVTMKPTERLHDVARRVLGTEADAWLSSTPLRLGGRSPLEAAETPEGIILCLDILRKFPLHPE